MVNGHWLIWGKGMKTLTGAQRRWDTVGRHLCLHYTLGCTIRELFPLTEALCWYKNAGIPKRAAHETLSFICTQFVFICAVILCNGIFYLYKMSHAQMHSFYRALKLITWQNAHFGVFSTFLLFYFFCSSAKGVTELSCKLLGLALHEAAFDHWQLCFLHCSLTKISTASINIANYQNH